MAGVELVSARAICPFFLFSPFPFFLTSLPLHIAKVLPIILLTIRRWQQATWREYTTSGKRAQMVGNSCSSTMWSTRLGQVGAAGSLLRVSALRALRNSRPLRLMPHRAQSFLRWPWRGGARSGLEPGGDGRDCGGRGVCHWPPAANHGWICRSEVCRVLSRQTRVGNRFGFAGILFRLVCFSRFRIWLVRCRIPGANHSACLGGKPTLCGYTWSGVGY